MSRGIAAATSHRRYGAIDTVPQVEISDPNVKVELGKLCYKVANNIQTLNNLTKKLQIDVGNIGTTKDSESFRYTIKATQFKCNDLVEETVPELNTLKDMCRSSDKESKLNVERLQGEMQAAVPVYMNVMKQINDKLRQHVLQEAVSPTEDIDEFHLREQEAAYNEQQKQVQVQLQFEEELYKERLASVKDIEVKILDGNAIMRMLATQVYEQGAVIDTIEQNTENTLANVELANQEVRKAASYVGRRRRTVLCLALVAVIVVVIIIVIAVTK